MTQYSASLYCGFPKFPSIGENYMGGGGMTYCRSSTKFLGKIHNNTLKVAKSKSVGLQSATLLSTIYFIKMT